MKTKFFSAVVFVASLCTIAVCDDAEVTALDLMEGALDQTRGVSSYTELRMDVVRPDWSRSSEFSVWTKGRDNSLIRFTAPAKDRGNATLKKGDAMWTYSPAIRRAIRLPKSMMSQDWAGSDFSYSDLARSDELINIYELSISARREEEPHTIFVIEAKPLDDAPVVWGKEVIELRDDYVLLSHRFFDQEMVEVKRMETREIGSLGGREIPIVMRAYDVDSPDSWTEITYLSADFDANIADNRFTQFALRGED